MRALTGEGAEEVVAREPFAFPRPWHHGNSSDKAWVDGNTEGVTRLWDLTDRKLLHTLKGEVKEISAVGLTEDGSKAVTGLTDGTVHVWDLKTGQTRLLSGHKARITSLALTNDGHHLLTGSADGTSRFWDADRGELLRTLKGHKGPVGSVALAPDGRRALTGGGGGVNAPTVYFSPDGDGELIATHDGDQTVMCWDLETEQRVWSQSGPSLSINSLSISADGQHAVAGGDAHGLCVYAMRTGEIRASFSGKPHGLVEDSDVTETVTVGFSPDASRVFVGGKSGKLFLFDASKFETLQEVDSGVGACNWIALSSDRQRALVAGDKGALVDLEKGRIVGSLGGHQLGMNSVAFAPRRDLALSSGKDKTAKLWRLVEGKEGVELCRLIVFKDNSAMAVDPEGRFDSTNLEATGNIHWVFSDDPFRPLPAGVFMRDYFTPRLLPILNDPEKGKRLAPVRSLASLNRVQPLVSITDVAPGRSDDEVSVQVEVAPGEGQYGKKPTTRSTSVYDVRLFRDRQLVGRWPEPSASDDAQPEPDPTKPAEMDAWRAANLSRPDGDRAKTGPDGGLKLTFPVRLPRRPGQKVEFTAYAFNEDRVKSTTTPPTLYEVPEGVSPARPRAYVVAFGAAGFSDPDWDLRYAADDARLAAQELGKALRAAGQYEVVPVVLATDRGAAGRPPRGGEAAATAAHLKAVLDRLAGRPVDPATLAAIPGAGKLSAATPDDLVILFTSSHGYTDPKGAYYLFPCDLGPPRSLGRVVTPDLLESCVSSGELSAWLRKVDAGQLALIVDCCHAAATVEQPGFKPGPMGSRGLGQLAYDKAMRVLAASAADDVALEALVKGEGSGLLTYALVREGLMRSQAAKSGGGLTLGGLLKYAEGRVPTLYAEVLKSAKGGKGATAGGARVLAARGAELEPLGDAGAPEGSSLRRRNAFQTPALFDYARGRDVVLGGEP